MSKQGAFQERLLSFDRDTVPPTARTRLRRFLGGAGGSGAGGGGAGGGGAGGTAAGKAAAPAGLAAVEAAVGAWCAALLRYTAAMEEVEMAREQTSCTPAMQAAHSSPAPSPEPDSNSSPCL